MDQEKKSVVDLAQGALQSNKEHLDALTEYTQKLEAELEAFDKLLDAVDTVDESDLDVGSFVTVPGSVRATAPIAAKALLSPESPFYEDALKRSRYKSFSEVHPMKTKELEALAEAVQAEIYRQHALDAQKRGFQAFPNTGVDATPIPLLDTNRIDWDRVAEKVSAVSTTTRTAKECEIRWLGEQHPEFNREPWDEEEVLKVKSIVAEFAESPPDWVVVANRLGTRRTPLDCMRHATSRKVHQWTTESDERLLKAIRIYGHDNWHLVARYVSEDATPSQCSSRFQRSLDESIKHTAWSPEEDSRLSAAVTAHGSSWVDIAANLPGRHNDQCRERWTEQLNPSINRGQWSEEEDKFLLDYVREHENASWKKVSEHVGNGRTEAMCRTRYAALQRNASAVPVTPTVSSEVQTTSAGQAAVPSDSAVASSSTLCFESFLPPSNDAGSTRQEYRQPNQLIFLEPVVSSNAEPRRSLSSRYTSKFKTITADDIRTLNNTTIPPTKKRKTQPRTARKSLMKKPQKSAS